MSNLVLFTINDRLSYDQMLSLSNGLVELCLEKQKGVIFNFLGYEEDFIKKIDANFYFSISDDFLQLNSEFCDVCDILDLNSKEGKTKFVKKFSIFDEIYLFLIKNKVKNCKLYISDQDYDLSEYKKVYYTGTITDCLYDYILTTEAESYSFGAILLELIK